ncbi:MAG TPA: hypothetical protein VN577_10085 [Terriglobales bacterium]|nr:hypothetical protein [Terriglobales bacterium]
MIYFANGTLFGTPNAGNLAPNPTPMKFGFLQDISVELSGDSKQLFGQYQYPVDTARGKTKITWKAKFAQINGKLFNDLFFAETMTTPMNLVAVDEAAAIPASPFTVTVANSAKFVEDKGVVDVSTGHQLVKVASAPATGQYSVSAGVYTFAAADTGKAVLINYTYNAATGVGMRIPITNHLMGFGPIFSMTLTNAYKGQNLSMTLNACRAEKLAFATKQDDYMIPEIDGSAFADASNNIGYLDLSE